MNPTEYGTSKGMPERLLESAKRRFERRLLRDGENGCWEWSGFVKPDGYVQVRVGRRRPYAHRLFWEINVGEIPEGMHLLHRCDNRRCVNPAHLFLGTHQDNMRDRNEKGRQGCGGHQKRKLTVEDVQEIKSLSGRGLSYKEVAARYEVSWCAIRAIWTGKTWKWV